MPLVRYTENKNPSDPVGALRLEPGEDGAERVLERGGDPLEVSDAELSDLSRRYVVEDVDAPEEDEAPGPSPQQKPQFSGSTSSASSQSGASSSPPTPGLGS